MPVTNKTKQTNKITLTLSSTTSVQKKKNDDLRGDSDLSRCVNCGFPQYETGYHCVTIATLYVDTNNRIKKRNLTRKHTHTHTESDGRNILLINTQPTNNHYQFDLFNYPSPRVHSTTTLPHTCYLLLKRVNSITNSIDVQRNAAAVPYMNAC